MMRLLVIVGLLWMPCRAVADRLHRPLSRNAAELVSLIEEALDLADDRKLVPELTRFRHRARQFRSLVQPVYTGGMPGTFEPSARGTGVIGVGPGGMTINSYNAFDAVDPTRTRRAGDRAVGLGRDPGADREFRRLVDQGARIHELVNRQGSPELTRLWARRITPLLRDMRDQLIGHGP